MTMFLVSLCGDHVNAECDVKPPRFGRVVCGRQPVVWPGVLVVSVVGDLCIVERPRQRSTASIEICQESALRHLAAVHPAGQ